jgi:hypothetical protein
VRPPYFRHLDGFQIQVTGLATILKHHTQELVYCVRDLVPDGFDRFFPPGSRAPRQGAIDTLAG